MSWMPKAERVAQLGESVRCNKTVSKVSLPRLRTSSQVNYPESAARPHVTRTFGGEALPAIRRKNQWDTTPGQERRSVPTNRKVKEPADSNPKMICPNGR